MPNVLIADDEKAIRRTLREILEYENYKVDEAEDGQKAYDMLKDGDYDVALCDIKMPKMDGMEVLDKLKKEGVETQMIMISGHGNIETAVEAVRKGAFDFISKPPDLNRLLITVRNAMDKGNLVTETKVLKRKVSSTREIVGDSPAILKIKETIDRVAPTEARVLVTGENGTGKELVAQAIHRLSPRREKPLITVNCAALPPTLIESELFGHEKGAFTNATSRKLGRFELAHGGTIFLDEVGELPIDVQMTLLRVLEAQEFNRVGGSHTIRVNVRVVAATNVDLEQAIKRGAFRADLFYRLNVFPLRLPTLRERRDDIPLLARHFAQKYGLRHRKPITRIHSAALKALSAYDWPGNVRQLRHVLENACIMSSADILDVDDLQLPKGAHAVAIPERGEDEEDLDLARNVARLERRLIERALQRSKGNRAQAARLLGIRRALLYARMKELGLHVSSEEES